MRTRVTETEMGGMMGALFLVLLLTLVLFGLGFTIKLLWYAAIAMFVVWLIGLVAHAPDRRWYRW